MTSLVLGVVGGIYGGAPGAAVGSAIGGFIDSYLFAPDPAAQEGPRTADNVQSTDSPGAPVPIVWGESNRIGTITAWHAGLKETEHTEDVKGGKLDGPTVATVTTYTYATDIWYVVGKTGHGGPFISVKRIWLGAKLFYDSTASPPFAASRAEGVTINLGTLTQLPPAVVEAAEGAGNVPAERTLLNIAISDLQLADWNNVIPAATVEVDAGPADLQGVVGDLCSLGNIPVAEQSVRNLEKTPVPGFVLKRLTSPRAALDVLSPVWQFDMADTGNLVTFRRRRRSADSLILESDLGAREPDAQPVPGQSRTLESARKLPREINLAFSDPDRDLQPNTVRTDKLATDDTSTRVIDYPGVLTAAQARGALDDILTEIWQAKAEISVSLPPKYIFLDAGDIVRLRKTDDTDVEWPRYLVTKWTLGANYRISVTLRPLARQWARRVAVATSGSINQQLIPDDSDAVGLYFDLPLLDPTNIDRNSLIAAAGSTSTGFDWPGANIYNAPNAVDFSQIGYFQTSATFGAALTALGDGPTSWPDRTNTVDVQMTFGALTSLSEGDFLDTRVDNYAVLGSEIINFKTATFLGGTQYRLEGALKRGRRGTGWATTTHAIGESFVLLTPSTVRRLELSPSLLGDPVVYKAVTIGATIAAASPTTFTVSGVWATPFAGEDDVGTRDGSDNITVTWSRGDRYWFGEWAEPLPMSEAALSFEVDFFDGVTFLRTKTVTAVSVSYSAAEQTTDGITPGDPVNYSIYQMSATVGRGYVLNGSV